MYPLSTRFIEEERTYRGPELRAHFILETTQIEGSALIAYLGPCDVETGHLVDWEDRLAEDFIRAKKMLHFQGEFFGESLVAGVFAQRLLVAICKDELIALLTEDAKNASVVSRDGDDLWVHGRKCSVSIVTSTAVSQLLHLGININPEGAPVAAIGFDELKIDAKVFATRVLAAWKKEWTSVARATVKVRPVG